MESNPLQNPQNRMTILQLALLGIALFSLHQVVAIHEKHPYVSLHTVVRDHIYITLFPSPILGAVLQ